MGTWGRRIGGSLDGEEVTTVGCEHDDCKVKAYACASTGPWELFPEFQYLIQAREPSCLTCGDSHMVSGEEWASEDILLWVNSPCPACSGTAPL
jgi:hypothetical protein